MPGIYSSYKIHQCAKAQKAKRQGWKESRRRRAVSKTKTSSCLKDIGPPNTPGKE
jgi:hypothetical protein